MNSLPSVQFSPDFDASIDKLSLKEQRLVNNKIRKLLREGISSGFRFKKITGNTNPNICELSYNMDLRQIVYYRDGKMLFLKVGHHDVIGWGEKCSVREQENAAPSISYSFEMPQLERQEVSTSQDNERQEDQKPFSHLTVDNFLELGIDENQAEKFLNLTEDAFLDLCDALPRRQAEILFEVFDDQMSFEDARELFEKDNEQFEERYPVFDQAKLDTIGDGMTWRQWSVFLDAHQRDIVEKSHNGPSLVYGGAGTGKTIVAIYRAAHLFDRLKNNSEGKIGLLTLSKVLAKDLQEKVERVFPSSAIGSEALYVGDVTSLAAGVLDQYYGRPFSILNNHEVSSRLAKLAAKLGMLELYTEQFIVGEFEHVIGPWALWNFDEYRDFPRQGRIKQLREDEREALSKLYSAFHKDCLESGLLTSFHVFNIATSFLSEHGPIFEHLVVDESQDLGPHMLRFIRSTTASDRDDITLCGDSGQAIYNRIHSYKKNGLEVTGKSSRLHVNYRTSKQIRALAEKITDLEVTNETATENRSSVSRFSGEEPQLVECQNFNEQIEAISKWIRSKVENGSALHEIAVIAREEKTLRSVKLSLDREKISSWILDDNSNYILDEVGLGTVDRIKGLEFRHVAVIDCNEKAFPLEEMANKLMPGDTADLQNFFKLEKNRLYVAVSRARDSLLITSSGEQSDFLKGAAQ